ncbi:NADPH:quinone reductase [Streptomyces graminofaciens]|uniref:NADPH:quinone reductase n=1 Tax=Streptomyces graminofaciens TaxID=68212 RepID=A0ABM7FG15_9ACTN|nr:NADP-dependent oxidoreductase [Streptomyces graminofaciens]BBC35125.1 NADPH:quinone reductase [Streptomyces graminofaciens]
MPKSYVFTEYGGPETQAFVDLPRPVPGPGQLLVAVHAAGVNPVDWKVRAGYLREFLPLPLPATFGTEVAGVVEEIGDGVEGFTIGDEVFGALPLLGGYAEYVLLPVQTAARKPAGVSFTDAATLSVSAATAQQGIDRLNLTPGATLLVNGAGGGIGVAAVQIARGLGATVIGTAGPGKAEFVSSLGATHVPYGEGVADRVTAVAPNGVDAVFDLVGGDALYAVAHLVADKSRIVTAADPTAAAELGGGYFQVEQTGDTLSPVAALVASGALDPHVTTVMPFAEAAAALAQVEAGHALGKTVLTMR